ncbi:MAG: GxxExxY protein [Armatimonadota bacterium]
MQHAELTGQIIGACYDVANDLGHGFVESVYQRALFIALQERNLNVASEVPLNVWYHGQVVGEFVADLVVDGVVLIELKAAKRLVPDHQAQVINYLNGTGLPIGLLANFGRLSVEIKRCERRGKRMEWSTLRASHSSI